MSRIQLNVDESTLSVIDELAEEGGFTTRASFLLYCVERTSDLFSAWREGYGVFGIKDDKSVTISFNITRPLKKNKEWPQELTPTVHQ